MINLSQNLEDNLAYFIQGGYLCIPRRVMNGLFSESETERRFSRLYVTLLYLAFHTDGQVKYKKDMLPCRKGQLITSYRNLARQTEIHFSKVKKWMDKLQEFSLIEVEPLGQGYRITVVGYDTLTRPPLKKKKKNERESQVPPAQTFTEMETSVNAESLAIIHSIYKRLDN